MDEPHEVLFEQLKVPILGVVENMSGEFFGTGAGEKLAERTESEFFGIVPLDARIRIGGDEGKPIVAVSPNAEAAQSIFSIAQKVAARVSVLTLQNQGNFIPIQMIG